MQQKNAPRIAAAAPAETAITQFDTASTAVALVPSSIESAMKLAEWLAQAKLIAGNYQGKPFDIFMVIMTGAELGLPPMASLRGLYSFDGKPGLEAKTKMAICLQRGAALYFKKTEDTDKAVTWETMRAGQSEPRLSRFTIEDANKAGLTQKKGPWQQYPRRMLGWRALGFLCDDTYPDVVLGIASAEDFEPEQMTFRPIGAGVELGTPPAGTQLERAPEASPESPRPPATSTPVTQPAPSAAAKPQMTEQEFEDAITAIGNAASAETLKEITTSRITSRTRTPEQHAKLLEAWEAQAELIDTAAGAERGK